MNKTFALMLTLGVSSVVFAADDKPITDQSTFVQKREIVKEEASKINKEVIRPVVQEIKEEASKINEEVIRPAVQEVKKTASNFNEKRKKWF